MREMYNEETESFSVV